MNNDKVYLTVMKKLGAELAAELADAADGDPCCREKIVEAFCVYYPATADKLFSNEEHHGNKTIPSTKTTK